MSMKDILLEARMNPGFYDYPEQKFWCYQLLKCGGQKYEEIFRIDEDKILLQNELYDFMPFDVGRFELMSILPNKIELSISSQETRILSVVYEGSKYICEAYGLDAMRLAGVYLGVFEEIWSIVEDRVNLLKENGNS